jgi:hypothetical protein
MSDNTTTTELETLVKDLKAKQAALKGATKLAGWEDKTAARNPCYVRGSVRAASAGDEEELGHVHGQVCTIRCQVCGEARTVNKQDAFQVRFCRACRQEAAKAAGTEKRAAKKLSGLDEKELRDRIAGLEAQLELLANAA